MIFIELNQFNEKWRQYIIFKQKFYKKQKLKRKYQIIIVSICTQWPDRQKGQCKMCQCCLQTTQVESMSRNRKFAIVELCLNWIFKNYKKVNIFLFDNVRNLSQEISNGKKKKNISKTFK